MSVTGDSAFQERYLTLIGAITLSWAMSEMVLDNMVAFIFHVYGGQNSQKTIPSISFKNKRSYVYKSFNNKPELASYKDEAFILLDRMLALSDERHWCIHGAALNLHSSNNSTTQTMYRVVNEVHQEIQREVTLETLDNLLSKMIALSADLSQFLVKWAQNDPLIQEKSKSSLQHLHTNPHSRNPRE